VCYTCGLHENSLVSQRAVLVAVQLPDQSDADFDDSLAELGRLAKTLGLLVAGTVVQKRAAFHVASYIGAGKIEELKALLAAQDAHTVVLEHEVSPSQARTLETALDIKLLDRTGVILEIFHRHARSRAAKAQVEIVRLQYMAPRLRELGAGADRQRGGIGGKGAGESGMELDRRKIRDRVAELTAELSQLSTEAETQRSRRRELNRVALVGYTNAGKSTLMRALTGSDVLVADKLFATLDTTVRMLMPETRPKVLLSDTVGFIDHLPHGLVASFKSTLDEALEASLLLHVIDASDRGWRRQLGVTRDVLEEIGAGYIPRLLLFNKFDRVGDAPAQAALAQLILAEWPDAVILSAKSPDDIRFLHAKLEQHFRGNVVEDDIHIAYHRQHLRAALFAECQVLGERYDESGVIFRVLATPATIDRLRTSAAEA
jgi:GTP-binding protein HflX